MKKLKENLRAKLSKNVGFTLVEMLIVVAIIAILIAVSIPLVNGALERAREATDAANERSFKAELTLCYLNGEIAAGTKFQVGTIYLYDATNGKLATEVGTGNSAIKAYGKGTDAGQDTVSKEGFRLWGCVNKDGEVFMGWYNSATVSGTMSTNKDLTGPFLM